MTRININGTYLDVPSSVKMQYKRQNSLFAFGDLECERTTEFSLPCTPKNNKVFTYANNLHTNGNGARQLIDAQLQDGVNVFDGQLYVRDIEDNEYKCVFVFGDLDALLTSSNAGELSEYLDVLDLPYQRAYDGTDDAWQQTWSTPSNLPAFAVFKYRLSITGRGYMPSLRLKTLIDVAAAKYGISVNFPQSYSQEQWNRYLALYITPNKVFDSQGNEVEDTTQGAILPMAANLPKCTLADIITTLSAISGKMIYVSGNTINFIDGLSNWREFSFENRVAKFSKLNRSFCEFAQNNQIIDSVGKSLLTDYDDYNYNSFYHIDNDTIEKENNVQELPFEVSMKRFSGMATFEEERDSFGISYLQYGSNDLIPCALGGEGVQNDQFDNIAYSATIATLCNKSTSIEVTAKMTTLEYSQITPDTIIVWNNARWVWTSMEYSDGYCKINLSMVS